MSADLHKVHVRVNDAATGKPTPCRLSITGPDGTYYAPLGRLSEFALGVNEDVGGNLLFQGVKYAYIDGTCEIQLPAGQLSVTILKGPEYQPLRQEINLPAGKLALRFTIERWINLREQGWYSGDCRCHYLSPHAALLESRAEDLAVTNVLAVDAHVRSLISVQADPPRECWCDRPAIPNILAFSGQQPALQTPESMVVVNTYNCHPYLGKLALLNCHRIVFPLWFGGPAGDNWTLADWCDQCHRKRGLVVWGAVTDTLFRNVPIEEFTLSDRYTYGEALADVLVGKVDALEVGGDDWQVSSAQNGWYGEPIEVWTLLLNAGCRLTLVGSSGKESNERPLGVVRTYAWVDPSQELTYAQWIESVRAGRTFVTLGPLLTLLVNGERPGSIIRLSEPAVMQIHAEVHSLAALDFLEVLVNGNVVASAPPTGEPATATIDLELPVAESCWIAARAAQAMVFDETAMSLEEDILPIMRKFTPLAYTSAIYVEVAERPFAVRPEAVARLQTCLDATLHWIETKGRFDTEKHRQALRGILQQAKDVLTARLNA